MIDILATGFEPLVSIPVFIGLTAASMWMIYRFIKLQEVSEACSSTY